MSSISPITRQIHPKNFIDKRKKSISFDQEIKKRDFKEEKQMGSSVLSPEPRRKSKFNVYENLQVKSEAKTKNNNHAISLLHIIKTLKKVANALKSRVGLAPIQNIDHQKQLRFMNDLSFFPDLTNKHFFLKRYTEKNVKSKGKRKSS